MESIGERLEEARKRKGISLREAAEGTKIRSDFLGYIEQNKFDFDLPELYKRGFIKNYARYLKLDVEKIITDYNAQLLSNSRGSRKGSAELFGQMEINKPHEAEATSSTENGSSYGRISSQSTESREGSHDSDDESDKIFYLKIGVVFVGVLTLVFVVFGLLKAILSSGDDVSADADLAPTEITQPADPVTPTAPEVVGSNQLRLVASGTVYVLVKQQSDDAILYRDTMSEGQTVDLTKNGAVDILFTAGENITIESGGEKLRPSSSGTAKITLP
ncbi:MAG: helix-turn-helix domain-containing protein [Opitutaceae bacterium]